MLFRFWEVIIYRIVAGDAVLQKEPKTERSPRLSLPLSCRWRAAIMDICHQSNWIVMSGWYVQALLKHCTENQHKWGPERRRLEENWSYRTAHCGLIHPQEDILHCVVTLRNSGFHSSIPEHLVNMRSPSWKSLQVADMSRFSAEVCFDQSAYACAVSQAVGKLSAANLGPPSKHCRSYPRPVFVKLEPIRDDSPTCVYGVSPFEIGKRHVGIYPNAAWRRSRRPGSGWTVLIGTRVSVVQGWGRFLGTSTV